MISLNQVLVATDFSEPSVAALRYGRGLAAAFHASLHVVHVVPDSMALPWATMADGLAMTDVQKQWEREAQQRLEQLIPENERPGLSVHLVTLAGDPVRQITAYAKDRGFDLLVIGTHGRGPLSHLVLGSVAERIVRTAPCPVLTVRHPQHEFITESLVACTDVRPVATQ